jgi:hypothetical protein
VLVLAVLGEWLVLGKAVGGLRFEKRRSYSLRIVLNIDDRGEKGVLLLDLGTLSSHFGLKV